MNTFTHTSHSLIRRVASSNAHCILDNRPHKHKYTHTHTLYTHIQYTQTHTRIELHIYANQLPHVGYAFLFKNKWFEEGDKGHHHPLSFKLTTAGVSLGSTTVESQTSYLNDINKPLKYRELIH